MKKIMVIAGGDWQIDLIKCAKKMGYYVICSNLYEDSPAFKYCDAHEVSNVLDKEKNLEIARKYQPDAVISDQSDIAVPTVAYVNEQLGLNGIGYETARLFSNKYLLRNMCREQGFMIPEYKKCYKPEDAYELLRKFGKIIIKPIDSQSSRGVFTIMDKDQLHRHYEESMSFSNSEKAFLAEEYLEGDEFTIDGLIVNGNHYPLCISIKKMYASNSNISQVQTYTTYHDTYDYDLLRKTNRDLIMHSGLKFGLTHSEYKFSKGQFYLIEAGARGGGSNLSSKIVPFMSGIDNYYYYIKSALGETVDDSELKELVLPKDNCAIMRFFDFEEGVVDRVLGKDVLLQSPYLIDYQLEIKRGDILKVPQYGRLRPGYFVVAGTSFAAIQAEAEKIVRTVQIQYK